MFKYKGKSTQCVEHNATQMAFLWSNQTVYIKTVLKTSYRHYKILKSPLKEKKN